MIRQEIVYHPDSYTIKEYKEYYNDILVIHKTYNDNEELVYYKTLKQVKKYYKNHKHGQQLAFYKNGTIHIKGFFIMRRLEGEYIRYDEMGEIEYKAIYLNHTIIEVLDKTKPSALLDWFFQFT